MIIRQTFSKRAEQAANPIAKQLLQLMDAKKTNLAVNIDVTKREELLHFAKLLGDEICILKTHIDMIDDFDDDFIVQLTDIAKEKRFLIFEDRKFADIGHVVQHQYGDGVYRIADWAHITNAHIIPGEGIVQGLKKVGLPKNRGLLLIAEMSSKGSLAQGSYTDTAVKMAEDHQDFVIGFISQRKLSNLPGMIHLTPGVKLETGTDQLGQQYRHPSHVIKDQGSDIIIVGRGIIGSENPKNTAQKYRKTAWDAYIQIVNEELVF